MIDIDTIPFGENFDVIVNIENTSDEPRTIRAMLSASSIYYTGASAFDIKKSQGKFTMQPGQKEVLKIVVHPEEYLNKLVEHSLVKIYAIANVEETKQTWSEEDDFALIKPKMEIAVDDDAFEVMKEFTASFR